MTQVKTRPILMSAPMVNATLSGAKTQTRRIMKPQPPKNEDFRGSSFGLCRSVADEVEFYFMDQYERLPKHPRNWDLIGSVGVARNAGFPMKYACPYGQIGDRLWVRETWRPVSWSADGGWGEIGYAAGGKRQVDGAWTFGQAYPEGKAVDRWRSPIRMPRWASRITLEITEVRVERLQSISEADAIAEGIASVRDNYGNGPAYCDYGMAHLDDTAEWFRSPMQSFQSLWKAIHGPGSWDANPWLWAISFKRVEAHP